MTPLVLGALALLLAGPVPAVLARAPRLRRTPRAAMLLWQSVALAAVLAALGAGVSLATDRAWRDRPDAVSILVAVLALALTCSVLARLLLSGHLVGTDLRAVRRRHRAQLELVSRWEDLVPRGGGVRVLEHEVPIAYCVPPSDVVVSDGVLTRLPSDEVTAVLAHERAHLRARHDLVLEGFSVLHRAFPRWVSSRAALAETRLLVEVLADRAGARAQGRRAVARALLALAEGRPPAAPGAVLGAAGHSDLVERIRLLKDTGPHRAQAGGLILVALAVLVVPTAVVVAPWLTGLA